MTLAIVNDYVVDRRLKLYFDQEDFDIVEEQWELEDELLMDLQGTVMFQGLTTWSALEPMHFKLLIATTMAKTFALIDEDKTEEANGAVESLSFLISALIRCIQERGNCHVEMIRLVRVGEIDLAVEYQAAIAMEEEMPRARKVGQSTKGISVVVDNS